MNSESGIIKKECGPNSECLNTFGSFECICRDGFNPSDWSINNDYSIAIGQPLDCRDINECERTQSLHQSTSINQYFPGNNPVYHTVFTKWSLTTMTHTCHAGATCDNTDGSYTCTCNDGYEDMNGDGRDCRDLNECTLETNHCHKVFSRSN